MTIKISSANKCQTNIENSTQLKIEYVHLLQEQRKLYIRQDSDKHAHHIRSNNLQIQHIPLVIHTERYYISA